MPKKARSKKIDRKTKSKSKKKVVEKEAKDGAKIKFPDKTNFEANFYQVGGPGSRGGPGAYGPRKDKGAGAGGTGVPASRQMRQSYYQGFPQNVSGFTGLQQNTRAQAVQDANRADIRGINQRLDAVVQQLAQQQARPQPAQPQAQGPVFPAQQGHAFSPQFNPQFNPVINLGQPQAQPQRQPLRRPPNLPQRQSNQPLPLRQPAQQPQQPSRARRQAPNIRQRRASAPPVSPAIPPQPRTDIPQPTPQPIPEPPDERLSLLRSRRNPLDIEAILEDRERVLGDDIELPSPPETDEEDLEGAGVGDIPPQLPERNIAPPSQPELREPPLPLRDDDPEKNLVGLDFLYDRYQKMINTPEPPQREDIIVNQRDARFMEKFGTTNPILRLDNTPKLKLKGLKSIETQTDKIPVRVGKIKGTKTSGGTQTDNILIDRNQSVGNISAIITDEPSVEPRIEEKRYPNPNKSFKQQVKDSNFARDFIEDLADRAVDKSRDKKFLAQFSAPSEPVRPPRATPRRNPTKDPSLKGKGDIDKRFKEEIEKLRKLNEEQTAIQEVRDKADIEAVLDSMISAIEQQDAENVQRFGESRRPPTDLTELQQRRPQLREQLNEVARRIKERAQRIRQRQREAEEKDVERISGDIFRPLALADPKPFSHRRGGGGRPKIEFTESMEEDLKNDRETFTKIRKEFKSRYKVNINKGMTTQELSIIIDRLKEQNPDEIDLISDNGEVLKGLLRNIKKIEARRRKR